MVGHGQEIPDSGDYLVWEGIDEAQLATMDLKPVAVREWNGLLWINLSGDAAGSLEASIDAFVEDLAPWNMSEIVLIGRIERIVNCNWKVLVDGFLEGFHVPVMHGVSIVVTSS